MLAVVDTDLAIWVPVAPAVALVMSAPSRVTRKVPALDGTSPRSVIPVGGVNVVDEPVPKNPTTVALPFVVVPDGAVTDAGEALNWPFETSTGVTVSTPP